MRYLVVIMLFAVSLYAHQQGSSVEALMNQGTQELGSNHYKQAAEAFEKAIELDPSNLRAHLALANACALQYVPGAKSEESEANLRCATEQYQAALQLDSTNKYAISGLARLVYNESLTLGNRTATAQKLDEAATLYRRLIEADPDNQEGYYYLGVIAWSKAYPACSEARKQLGMKPDDPGPLPDERARQQFATDYGAVIDTGISDLEKVLIINPDNSDAMSYLNLLLRERAVSRSTREESESDIAKAEQWANQAIEIKRQQSGSTVPYPVEPHIIRRPGRPSLPPPPPPPPPPDTSSSEAIHLGPRVAEANLIRKVEPTYPPLAKAARVQGAVEFKAVVGENGIIRRLLLVRGHPLLVNAAKEAVLQYVYRPTLLNGRAVEIETEVEVNFSLAGMSGGTSEPQ